MADKLSVFEAGVKYPFFGVGVLLLLIGAFSEPLLHFKLTFLVWIGVFVMIVGLVVPQFVKR